MTKCVPFLTTRRERLTPEQAAIPFYGVRRRVKGLRREEVAMLAGMSTDYYTRLERGNLSGVSDVILDSLARALQLDEAERGHLFNLASAAKAPARVNAAKAGARSRTARSGVREGVLRILDTINAPAYVRNARFDVVAANRLARALFSDAYADGAGTFNFARYTFLDARSRDFFVEWEKIGRDSVAALRLEAGSNPYDRGLTDLIGELSTRSDEFRTWWASHNVKFHNTSTKTLRHAVVGEIEVTGEALVLPGDPGLTIVTYTVEPASPSAEALAFLASWSTQNA